MGRIVLSVGLALTLATTGCVSTAPQKHEAPTAEDQAIAPPPNTPGSAQETEDEEEAVEMKVSIGGTNVSVDWEDNQAVADLIALASENPVTVELSMYGGFEQVGPLGTSLTASDEQMRTEPGDIVLYAGNQISVFYGPNSWAYTKLGHVTDRTAGEMADLLGNGDTFITIAIR